MRQQCWLEFLVSYDLDIKYTLRKANVVADALSRNCVMVASLVATPTLLENIASKQTEDPQLLEIIKGVEGGSHSNFKIDN